MKSNICKSFSFIFLLLCSTTALAECIIVQTGPAGDQTRSLVCYVDTINEWLGTGTTPIRIETYLSDVDFNGLISGGVDVGEPFDPEKLNESLAETAEKLCKNRVTGRDEQCKNNVYDNARLGVMKNQVVLCDKVQNLAQVFGFNFGSAAGKLEIDVEAFSDLFTECPQTIRRAETIERNFCINKTTEGNANCIRDFG